MSRELIGIDENLESTQEKQQKICLKHLEPGKKFVYPCASAFVLTKTKHSPKSCWGKFAGEYWVGFPCWDEAFQQIIYINEETMVIPQ